MRFKQRFIVDWRSSKPGQPNPQLVAEIRRNQESRQKHASSFNIGHAELIGRKLYNEEMRVRARDNG